MSIRIGRKRDGSVIAILPLVLLVIAIACAAFAFDYGHGLSVRTQLQNAADAAALAGAYELARPTVTATNLTKAEQYAREIGAKNFADDVAVDNNGTTTVSVQINGNTMPRTVTVTSTRTSANIFARLIGFNTIPVSATSTAQAYQGIKQIGANQLLNLAVSLDYEPTKGAQTGLSLQDYLGGSRSNKFTIVLNPQGAKNGAWLKNWNPNQNPVLTYGLDSLVMNGTDANLVADLSVGQTIYVPLVMGGPPFNQDRTIVGVVGFIISRSGGPQEIEGNIAEPIILKGTPGVPVQNSLGQQAVTFLEENQAWQVSLIN
jgi:Flp pilus assembly protein TadG